MIIQTHSPREKVDHIENMEMAIVACHFNWAGFIQPKRNLHRFIRSMKDYPLFGIELSLTNEFETTGIEGWKQITVNWNNVCFQKEALINKTVKELIPAQYTKIAWIDADVSFSNKNWYRDTCIALDYNNVIQMFDTGVWTDSMGRICDKQKAVFVSGPSDKAWVGHPGFALAAKRELWNHGGLYSECPIGHGDTIFAYTLFETHLTESAKLGIGFVKDSECKKYTDWRKSINNYVKRSVSYIKGECIHEWHGDKKDRQYVKRSVVIENFRSEYVYLNKEGILELTNDISLEQIQKILNYFKERKEDG